MLPTNEQLKVIKMVEDNLAIEFKGKTFVEAREFIMTNMKDSKETSDYYKKLLLDSYGGYKNIWSILNKGKMN